MNGFNRFKIAQFIALGATAFSVIGLIIAIAANANVGMTLMFIGFVAGLASYIFGGFLTALKMSGTIAKWGWIVIPFPYDILTFILSFLFAIVVFIFVPIIPVRKAYKEHMYY